MENNIKKEGYLWKASLHVKKFRKRWVVIRGNTLYSYKEGRNNDLTETIDLKQFNSVKISEKGREGQFELVANDKKDNRIFIASSNGDLNADYVMNNWIECIKQITNNYNDITITTYSQLINMGFTDKISFTAAHQFPNNLYKAIEFINSNDENLSEDNDIIKEGWIFKKGAQKLAMWKQRYLKLTFDKKLDYYKQKKQQLIKRGSIDLNKLTVDHIKRSKTKKRCKQFAFCIVTSKRIYEFRVLNKVDRDGWISKIRDIIHPHWNKQKAKSYSISYSFNPMEINDNIDTDDNSDEENIYNHVSENNLQEFNHDIDCNDINQCISVKRIINVLKRYQYISGNKTATHIVFDIMKFVISDYHHILKYHLNGTCNNGNDLFETIYDMMINENLQCSDRFNKCKIYERNNRRRSNKSVEVCNNRNILSYVDVLDCIHCYFLHSLDTGHRIKNNIDDKEERHGLIYYDSEIARIKSYLKKRECVEASDMIKNNKFSTKLVENDHWSEESDNEENENKTQSNKFKSKNKIKQTEEHKKSADIQYNFGEKYNYWDKGASDYIECKYCSFKFELQNNNQFAIDHNDFYDVYIKAMNLLNESSVIKSMKSVFHYKYQNPSNVTIGINNLMAVIFYTDFTELSRVFSATFRYLFSNETRLQKIQRNREYWWWSKLLIETVNCYGTLMNESNISVLYHGVTKVYFDQFITEFNSPTSTTTSLNVAVRFSAQNQDDDGIILELMKYPDVHSTLRFFDCQFVSNYANEQERLFISPIEIGSWLKFKSIRNMKTNENYRSFISAVTAFDELINRRMTANVSKSDTDIIENLISNKIYNNDNDEDNDNNYPQYILKSFKKWTHKKQNVSIDIIVLNNYYKGIADLLKFNIKNLLSFYDINIVFKNITKLYCDSIGIINENWFKMLLCNLDKLNKLQSSKLNVIELANVDNITSNNSFVYFTKYQAKFSAKNWKIEKYNRTRLKLTRT